MQILNVALGGTLVTHVPERWGQDVTHRGEPRDPVRHTVEVDATSRLSKIVGAGSLEVVSWHHQAVDRLGDGLRVVARSSDGLPEAVEPEDERWIVAVQWHPELSAHENDRQAALLRETVQAAETYTRRKRCD
jgi:putative glutamine amidotransferase